MHSGNNLRTAELLLNYLGRSEDLPDNELAENMERIPDIVKVLVLILGFVSSVLFV